jgi:uncharacterized protein YegL
MAEDRTLDEQIDFWANPEPRCPVVLLLDTSGSMDCGPIDQLNKGIETFKNAVLRDDKASLRVEVAIVTFNSSVSVIQEFVAIDEFTPPKLFASGTTSMGMGIKRALDLAENRKSFLKAQGNAYYKPWVFMITDGSPTDDWKAAADQVHTAVENRKLSFFAVGVQGADLEVLKQIASPRIPPVMLNGLKFSEMFVWLSRSIVRVSSGKVGEQVELPSTQTWTIEA